MDIKYFEKLVNKSLETGAGFSEVFYENKYTNNYLFLSSKIDKTTPNFISGIGIRLSRDSKTVYGSTNKLDDTSINNLIDDLSSVYKSNRIIDYINLFEEKIDNKYKPVIELEDFDIGKKKELFKRIDNYARNKDKNVSQVQIKLFEENQDVIIANSTGKYIKDNRVRIRLDLYIFVSVDGKMEASYSRFATMGGYEFLDKINFEEEIDKLIKETNDKIIAVPCPGGEMPVVIAAGFGGVIFHEACVHSLEAATTAKNSGPFANMIGSMVASNKVTLIDDGTLNSEWGSVNIDDEGNKTKKNILIENGILKSYLIDELNSKIMNMDITGSGRRENYTYAPTARMNNTYLAPGTDTKEDMIKSIKYGLYAHKMGGGSVNQNTSDFNFAVTSAYMIRDGKIAESVSDVCLIGNGSEIIKNVEMVGSDLLHDPGYCGADSGYVPVNVGQPTIKVSKILVGGKDDK
ncbi:MAG: TldD/PmbA family protein [Bacilli bacterium]|nr:TldD/PmbA family protein [Bacilli bacterium]